MKNKSKHYGANLNSGTYWHLAIRGEGEGTGATGLNANCLDHEPKT